MRKIPKKVSFVGSRPVFEANKGFFLREAERQLSILEHEISLRPKPHGPGNEGRRTVRKDGYVVECYKGFGFAHVTITVLHAEQEVEREREECFCGCHLAEGEIVKVEKLPCCFAHMEPDTVYDVEVCVSRNRFELFQNMRSTDFVPILLGQKVIVVWASADSQEEYSDKDRCKINDICMITSISAD